MNVVYKIIEKLYCSIPGNLAYIDQVTGCLNRNFLERELHKEFKKYNHVIVVDINNLKKINDTLGHLHGTRKIVRIANALRITYHKGKVIRTGGDEFLILTNELYPEFLDSNTSDFSYGYTYREENEVFEEVYDRADKKLYYMKQEYYTCHNRRNCDTCNHGLCHRV